MANKDPDNIVHISEFHEASPEGTTQRGSRRLLIDPLENVLVGSPLICKYLGIKSVTTMIEWHEVYGLPVMKRMDGQWMTTISAIDDWIWMASELEVRNRPYSRGDNKRAEIALQKAQRRVDRLKAKEAELGSREAASRAASADMQTGSD